MSGLITEYESDGRKEEGVLDHRRRVSNERLRRVKNDPPRKGKRRMGK